VGVERHAGSRWMGRRFSRRDHPAVGGRAEASVLRDGVWATVGTYDASSVPFDRHCF